VALAVTPVRRDALGGEQVGHKHGLCPGGHAPHDGACLRFADPSSALWVRPTKKPSAVAPQARAAPASSQVWMPHTFTNTI
jgi:hypothetical protein